jgi:hypothetical protein
MKKEIQKERRRCKEIRKERHRQIKEERKPQRKTFA